MPDDSSTRFDVQTPSQGVQRTAEVAGRHLYHDIVTLDGGGAKQFKRSPTLKKALVLAEDTNASSVYFGDKDVTDSAGAKPGLPRSSTAEPIELLVDNADQVFVAGASGLVAILIGFTV